MATPPRTATSIATPLSRKCSCCTSMAYDCQPLACCAAGGGLLLVFTTSSVSHVAATVTVLYRCCCCCVMRTPEFPCTHCKCFVVGLNTHARRLWWLFLQDACAPHARCGSRLECPCPGHGGLCCTHSGALPWSCQAGCGPNGGEDNSAPATGRWVTLTPLVEYAGATHPQPQPAVRGINLTSWRYGVSWSGC